MFGKYYRRRKLQKQRCSKMQAKGGPNKQAKPGLVSKWAMFKMSAGIFLCNSDFIIALDLKIK